MGQANILDIWKSFSKSIMKYNDLDLGIPSGYESLLLDSLGIERNFGYFDNARR